MCSRAELNGNGNLGRQTDAVPADERERDETREERRRRERERGVSDERDMGGEVGNVNACKQFSALLCNLEVAVLVLGCRAAGSKCKYKCKYKVIESCLGCTAESSSGQKWADT